MMRSITPILLAATTLAAPSQLLSPQPKYSTWMANSIITRNLSSPATRYYDQATFYRSLEAIVVAHQNSSNSSSFSPYLSHITTQIDSLLHPNGTFISWDYNDHQLDNIRVASSILFLYTSIPPSNTPQRTKYKAALDFLYDQLVNKQKRNPEGGFWHKDPKYPNQMWLDGLYMAQPFYAAYTSLFLSSMSPNSVNVNTTAAVADKNWDDILLQFSLIEAHCRNATSGLLKHGYDASKTAIWADPITGASPLTWIRAQGWYLMALIDVLDYFPLSHPAYSQLIKWARQLARALKETQDPETGGWWLVMDGEYGGPKGRERGNYVESSGSVMYVYGLLKGVRKWYLLDDGGELVKVARRGYEGLVERFVRVVKGKDGEDGEDGREVLLNWEGTVRVGSLDGRGDFEYYTGINRVENSLIGVGPFILASVEYEMLTAAIET
ncbi:putative cell wall glycosyl hydrolase YteR [Neurospora tetraspora]|uniref:Cell wall glycosyl hydrolase YteR n=1 Tax=Neurospora tetraspora TaxID=94610 RepID=A0AAE0MSC1_9PEZI|nr:putative cell wall glycosyl hydrolase YteR [Neurospora tetraspora]